MQFTVHEAKTHFSKLLAHAQAGDEVIITSGTERRPVAQLSAYVPRSGFRLGTMKDSLPEIGLDHPFFDPLPEEELRLWNGEGD